MTILGRYLSREILSATLMVLGGFLVLFGFFDLFEELENIGRGGYRVLDAFIGVVLAMPSHVYELMPIAVLIGGIWALANLAQQAEFTAMRAAGLGRARALRELLGLGLACVAFTALVGEAVAPFTERWGQSLRLGAMGASVNSEFRSGIWVKDTVKSADGSPARLRFVNVGQVNPDGTIGTLRVYEFDPEFHLRSLLRAQSGRYDMAGRWILNDVVEMQMDVRIPSGSPNNPVAQETLGDRVIPPDSELASRSTTAQKTWDSGLDPKIVGVLLVQPERMAALDLLRYVRHLHANRQQAGRYEIALWKKVMYPFACLVMLVLALPFGYLQVRTGGMALKVFSGIMMGVAFHFLNGLSAHLGLLNTWPAFVAALAPGAFTLVLALGLLSWVDRVR